MIERGADHVGVEVAALAGVDLYGRCASGPDPLGVARRLLVAFDDGDRPCVLQVVDGPDQ